MTAASALDLAKPPLAAQRALWTHPTDYAACQDLADRARAGGIKAMRYESVRDPSQRTNVALLDPGALQRPGPTELRIWRVFGRPKCVQAECETTRVALEIPIETFAGDPRVRTHLGLH